MANNVEKKQLAADVAAKYNATENYLYGQKCVFPNYSKHGINGKPLHELTLAEADKLYDTGSVKGVLSLKEVPAPAKKETAVEKK